MIKDGNKAVSDVAYLFSELCAIYPITPSSPMASNVDDLSCKDKKNIFNDTVKVVEMQSEAGAAGCMHGALISGSLATTFTSSQGLLLMIPNMYKMAGERLPGVIHVASRSLATHALSIFGDHQDVYATRSTGFCMLASANVEDSAYMAAIAHLSAIKGSLPFLHFFDGFRTSHEINTVDRMDIPKIAGLVDRKKIEQFRKNSLNVGNNIEKGMNENEDIYFQSTEARNTAYLDIVNIVANYMNDINNIAGKDYQPFNYYGHPFAQDVIVAMGSVCDTIRLVVDDLNKQNRKVGMIEVHLYRPFSTTYLKKVLPSSTKRIAVLDRTKESGSVHEPLCLDVISALNDTDIKVVGGRFGLSSKNTTPSQIKSVFDMLNTELKDNFVIGIIDDVTNLSLQESDYSIDLNATELVVYGYGSDGMVSACKDILSIINGEEKKYVQGYFEYDSKKSGGVTKSSLRISDYKINAPFYIDKPKCIVIAKEEYIFTFDTISNIRENGIVFLNTRHGENLNGYLPNKIKKVLKEKKVTLVTLDANLIASNNNLDGKISKIMEIALLELLGVKGALSILVDSIEKKFKTKGREVVTNNINAIKKTLGCVKKVKEDYSYENAIEEDDCDIFDIIRKREGNNLKVSDLLSYQSGTFPCSISNNRKENISYRIPSWIKENCIQCNMCSFVCPHGVIRPFIVDEEGINLIGSNDKKKFLIAVNGKECTGCGLCIEACPGKKGNKALAWTDNDTTDNNRLFDDYHNQSIFDKYTIKGSQFEQPKFAYSGACAGCGETAYIKLLTQLFKDDVIIANATGCSSIYGGSIPNTPYDIPWANSLFEDNAEFGLGIYLSYKNIRNRLRNNILDVIDIVDKRIRNLFDMWLDNMDDYEVTRDVFESLKEKDLPKEIIDLIDYIPSRSIWCIGGDGWAYDIGFSGIDHVLSSNENINILVLDTEVYSNTGGQASKSSGYGQVAEFSNNGKKTSKKDLFKIAMCYPNCYVASVSLGANGMQTIKAFKEAYEHNGPSIIIAYSPCVEQGIKHGMNCSLKEQKKLVDCGYNLLMRYKDNKLTIDSKEPDFSKYEESITNEVRYKALEIKDKVIAEEMLKKNKQDAIDRYNYYKSIEIK